MKNERQGSFVILSQSVDVSAFLEDVRQAADSERDSLGFYAASVYREYALKGNLFVAVDADQGQQRYAGHLLFDLRQPRAKVLQVFVSPVYRGQHLASRLVEGLKAHLTDLQYMSIEARVAEDMKSSNAFWESQGFYAQRVVPGGTSRGKRRRMIVARSHELASPQLFSSSGINGANPFGLTFVSGNEKPTYLLDMNVLFDLGPRRHRRDDVINLFRAERMQVCSLAVSSEIQVELKRSASPGKTDPMQDFAAILPTYATPKDDETGELMQALADIVFSERSKGHLTSNDKSDLRHLLTAITHGLQGLVTSDAAILNAASSLKTRHQIDVLSPAAFSLPETYPIDTSAIGTDPDRVLALDVLTNSAEGDVRSLLSQCGILPTQQVGEWAAAEGHTKACRRYVVRCNDQLIGYMTWHTPIGQNCVSAMIAVDEVSPASTDCARLMLSKLNEQIDADTVVLVRLGFPTSQVIVRGEALSLGFTACEDASAKLQKIVIRGLITPANWKQRRDALSAACGVRLPHDLPVFRSADQHIEVYTADGNRTHLPMLKLESMMAPALFCLPGRAAIIAPVRRQFSEHLLQHLPQASLLPQARAQLYQQRHYISHHKTLSTFAAGSLVFFYESQKDGGLGSIIAIGRVVRSYLQNVDSIGRADLDASVLERDQLSFIGKTDSRTITVFDNLTILPKPVDRDTLLQLDCGTPVKLLSAQKINTEQVQGILAKAYSS